MKDYSRHHCVCLMSPCIDADWRKYLAVEGVRVNKYANDDDENLVRS